MAFLKTKTAKSEGEVALRNSIFPGSDERIWDRTRDQGFIAIPKTLPFIAQIIDQMSPKGQPLSGVYQLLWTYTFNNNAFVRLGNLSDLAFAAGFKAERGERTLRDRLRKLAELGFIELKPHGGNPTGFAFIPNPHEVILALHDARSAASPKEKAKRPELREETFNAFLARAVDVKAADVARIQKAQQAARAAASASTPATPPPVSATPIASKPVRPRGA